MIRPLNCAVITIVAALSLPAFASDWPQWGGPNRDHVSTEKGFLQKWPEGGPKKVWQNESMGIGFAGISVANGKVFTMGGREGMDYLIAVEEKSGKELWATEIAPSFKERRGDGPRSTPTVESDRVYALTGSGTLVAADVPSGKLLWKTTMQELGGRVPNWGYSESVLVKDGTVYCTPGGNRGAIAAFDAKTGELKWQSKGFTESAQYSSIVPAQLNGEPQLVQLTMKKLAAVSPGDGKLLWESDWPGQTAVIPSPVIKDNFVYITSGYGVGSKLVKIAPGKKPENIYQNKVMNNHHGGVVLFENHVYGHSDRPVNAWVCQNFMTGEEIWRSSELPKGSIVYADGRLYCLDERTGTIALAEASPEGWREHGRFKFQPQSKQRSIQDSVWVHPVIANGKLYLRDQELLFCYDISTKS